MNRSGARRVGLAVTIVVAVTAPGCAAARDELRPDCNSEARSSLLLMAQSVRGAQLIPCLTTIPAGWSFVTLEVTQEGSEIDLASDRGGTDALVVSLVPDCDIEGSKRIPSDEPGTRRFERVRRLRPTYSGQRFYDFPGGCVIYDFDLETDRASVLLNEASLMLSFVSRRELRDQMSELTGGGIDDAP